MKLLEENIRETLYYICSGNNLLNRSLIAQEIKARIDIWEYIKLKSFCTAQGMMNSKEAAYRMGDYHCHSFDRGLISRHRDEKN